MTMQPRRVLDAPTDSPDVTDRPARMMGRPIVAYAIIGVCTGAFFWRIRGTGLPPLALYGPSVARGDWWLLVSSVFEHGGLAHLAMNMYAVWGLGVPLERLLGSARFLAISIATAIGASLLAMIVDFRLPTVGASGMILGWAGAMLPILNAQGRRMLWRNALLPTALITVFPLLMRLSGQTPMILISWAGHLGGFLTGVVCGFALRLRHRTLFFTVVFGLAGALFGAGIVAAELLKDRSWQL